MKRILILLIACALLGEAKAQADDVFNYIPIVLGANIQRDAFKLSDGTKFSNSDNGQIAYITVSNNNAFCLGEMDFLPALNRQFKYSATNNDTIASNNFQFTRIMLGFYSRGSEKRFKIGGVGLVEFSLKDAAMNIPPDLNEPASSPNVLIAASGAGLGIGLSVMQYFDNRLAINHNLGIATMGNTQNEPNWYGKYYFYLINASWPFLPRLSANGYLNLQYYDIKNQSRLANDQAGNIFVWQLRFGIGIHIGRDPMF